jgi:hypothetical protein
MHYCVCLKKRSDKFLKVLEFVVNCLVAEEIEILSGGSRSIMVFKSGFLDSADLQKARICIP